MTTATRFPRGAKPTPRHKLCGATPHKIAAAPPAQFSVVPKQLSYWLNDSRPDCVTAEEAFAKAAFSVMAGLPELFIPDAEVGAWATSHGFLNGANLTDVMDAMAQKGFLVAGVLYGDGPYQSVDWTNPTALQSAICQGPVKIGVASAQFESIAGVGEGNGWFMTGLSKQDPSAEDHCVALCGYGPMSYLFGLFNKPVPSGADPSALGYLLFTWSGIGVIDPQSLDNVTFEAWVRTPTTPGQAPAPGPSPAPAPAPTPGPAPEPLTLTGATTPTTITITIPGSGLLRPAQSVSIPIPALAVTVSNATPAPGGPILPVLLPLILQYGAKVLPVVLADLAAGKTVQQILADVLAALVTPAGK